jgi:hypothetical protein
MATREDGLKIQHALAVSTVNQAISVLENYGQHHGWCKTKKSPGAPCDCRYDEELWVLKQQRQMVEGGSTSVGDEDRSHDGNR